MPNTIGESCGALLRKPGGKVSSLSEIYDVVEGSSPAVHPHCGGGSSRDTMGSLPGWYEQTIKPGA